MSRVARLTVLGSGVLGGQIAFHSAFKGKTVVVYDIAEDAIERCQATHDQYAPIYQSDLGATETDIAATKQRLTFTTDLAAAVAHADLVIEAVPEIPDVKTSVYKEMAEFAIEIGMMPIPVRKEHNGYVANTWVVPMLNAAQTLVTNEIATPEHIDRTFMVLGAPMGPLGMLDMIGMTTAYNVLSHWGRVNGDAQMIANADYLKENFLDKGLLGAQTGKGYYEYPDPAFGRPGFLDVPDISVVPHVVSLISPR
jgi:3-hydroxyacyl-CoA dehydrogenase